MSEVRTDITLRLSRGARKLLYTLVNASEEDQQNLVDTSLDGIYYEVVRKESWELFRAVRDTVEDDS